MDLNFIFFFKLLICVELITSVYAVHKKDLNYDNVGRGKSYNIEPGASVVETDFIEILPVPNWPSNDISLGQVSGVSLDSEGTVYVFHRDKRSWNDNSFFNNNTFAEIYLGPITNPTVAVIDPETGNLLYSWGRNKFYLPHGITVDSQNNVWITDVALHQVLKFPPLLKSKSDDIQPLLTLGEKFMPGSSVSRFCKPTAVAVLPTGEFFVSDGYCNSRIIKFNSKGEYLIEWGRSTLTRGPPSPPAYNFFIPHDLTVMDDRNLVCVSDRENGRIQCFQTVNGSFAFDINYPSEIGYRLFSASYTSAAEGLFFIVNGPDYESSAVHGSVVSMNAETLKPIKTFQPAGQPFQNPHDVILSSNGTEVYVAELDPQRVTKFQINYKNTKMPVPEKYRSDNKSSATMLMAIFITAIVICFGAVLLAAALIYSKTRTRGMSLQLDDLEYESNFEN